MPNVDIFWFKDAQYFFVLGDEKNLCIATLRKYFLKKHKRKKASRLD